MDRLDELKIQIIQQITNGQTVNFSGNGGDFMGYSDKEVILILDKLISGKYLEGGFNKLGYAGQVSVTGEDLLESLLKEKEEETFRGKLKKNWYKGIALIISVVTLIFVILEYFCK